MALIKLPTASLSEVAALPVRLHPTGIIEVMLIRAAETARWIIPMRRCLPGFEPQLQAAAAARDAAGVTGFVDPEPFAHFIYERRLAHGPALPCTVAVYILQAAGAPDESHRDCDTHVWLRSREAARHVCNMSLQRLIDRAGRSVTVRRMARLGRDGLASGTDGAPLR